MERKFSKDCTLAIKGIAIILLLWHHLFWKNYTMVQSFSIGEVNLLAFSAQASNLCVSLFFLLSAYGLTVTYKKWNAQKKSDFSFIADRYISLLAGFVLICVFGYVSGAFLDRNLIDIYGGTAKSFFLVPIDMLGLARLFDVETFNPTWWYMSLAAILIFVFPVAYKYIKKYGIAAVLSLSFLLLIPQGAGMVQYFAVASVGIYLANINGFVRLADMKLLKTKWLNKIIKFALISFSFAVLIILRMSVLEDFDQAVDGLIAVLISWFALEFLLLIKPLKIILVFLGKHSANVFMTHTLFYSYYFKDFYYSFKNPFLVFAVLLLTSLLFSVALEFLKQMCRYNKLIFVIREKIQLRFNRVPGT